MKKATLLLALLLISTFGFSQIGGSDPISGIDIIIKTIPGSKITNTGNEPIIEEVNKLQMEYLNLKAKEVHYEFAGQDLSKLKTKEEVFKAYIEYLKKKNKEQSKKNSLYRRTSERLRHKNRTVQEKAALIKKSTMKKRTNVRDAHDKY